MITYRIAYENEREECLRLINFVFQDIGVDILFERELSKVYNNQNPWHRYHFVAVDDSRGLLGAVGCLPNRLHIGSEVLNTGYIGSVSVHPEARGEGHMKRLMALALESARKSDTDILILSGRRQRYAYFGYETAGIQMNFEITDSCIRHSLRQFPTSSVRFESLLPGSRWEREAEKLQRSHWAWMERTPSFTECACSYGNKVFSAFLGEEWLGCLLINSQSLNVTEINAISWDAMDIMIKAWQEQNRLKSFEVTVPGWNIPQQRHIWGFAETVSQHVNARVRVVRWRPVVERLLQLKAMGTPLRDGVLTLSVQGEDTFTIRISDNQISVGEPVEEPVFLTLSEAETLLFHPFGENLLQMNAFGWFPLPLCILQPDTF